jgi:hypothetical protein
VERGGWIARPERPSALVVFLRSLAGAEDISLRLRQRTQRKRRRLRTAGCSWIDRPRMTHFPSPSFIPRSGSFKAGTADLHFGETDRATDRLLLPHPPPHNRDREGGRAIARLHRSRLVACSLCSPAPLPGAIAEPGGRPVGVRLSGGAAGHPAFGVEREARKPKRTDRRRLVKLAAQCSR